MATMYHGTSSAALPIHEGLCLTSDDDRAREYAAACYGTRYVHEVTIDLAGLAVTDLDEGYDRDANEAPADADPASFGCDVIIFADETPHGHHHTTWRLLTTAALAAITVTATTEED